jgi:hypothetical protein
MAYDVVIKNGTVVDGTGREPYRADVAIQGERIAEIGKISDAGKRTINADGQIVTPGFVDIHTHLDAQIWWDPVVSSSCWHGVTSVVMGNCGVTFAPCRPEDREYLAHLMESVEDIPAQSIMAGMPWQWETYGQYLKALDARPKGVNVGGMVGHCGAVLGDGRQSLDNKPTNARNRPHARYRGRSDCWRRQVLDFAYYSASHAGRSACSWHVCRIRRNYGHLPRLGKLGRGLVEAAPGIDSGRPEDLQREVPDDEVSLATGRPVTFGLAQVARTQLCMLSCLDQISASAAEGAQVLRNLHAWYRVLFGFVNRTPFDRASWKALHPQAGRKVAKLCNPEYRADMSA